MRIAVIDIGTNTSRLAVFNVSDDGRAVLTHERNEITRPGEGLRETGRINADAAARTISVIREYKTICDSFSVERVATVGTAAFRMAANSADFMEMVRKTGLELEILSGEREGELAFRGVLYGMETVPGELLVVDVGGGSAEFIFGGADGIRNAISLPLGAVVMRDRFLRSDPPVRNEMDAMAEHVCSVLKTDVIDVLPSVHECVGVAGTVSTLAMVDLGLTRFDPEKVLGHVLEFSSVQSLACRLLAMGDDERKGIPGMEPGRADIIHAGAFTVEMIMQSFGLSSIKVSLFDLRHGLAAEMIERIIREV